MPEPPDFPEKVPLSVFGIPVRKQWRVDLSATTEFLADGVAAAALKSQAEASARRDLGVASPVADTINRGRGAIVAASSTFVVSSRSPGRFSHKHPPCM